MSYEMNGSEFARVTVDALAGAGYVLRAGDIVEGHVLGDYLQTLLANGAVEMCELSVAIPGEPGAELL